MSVQVQCPNPDCRASFSASDAELGQPGHCLKCGQTFSLFTTRGSDAPPAGDTDAVWTAPRASELAAGETFGRYRILRRLGRGGMGTVYLAHDTHLERDIALKIPHVTAGESPEVVQRFYREARALARFDHPNICPVHDVGQVDGVLFLTMTYVEGRPLSELVTQPPLPQRRAAEVVRTLARTLAEAHARGIIHRDLKPANVLISARRELVIVDFGLARRLEQGDSRLTQVGSILGTPAYMAPEQVSGDIAAMGPGCDIYSLGVILYELLTGRLPFEGPASVVMGLVMVADPPPPSAHRPDLDRLLEVICCKAMAKKVQDRHPSMAALAETLDEYLLHAQTAGSELQPRGDRSGWPPDVSDQRQPADPTPVPTDPVMTDAPALSPVAKPHEERPSSLDREDILPLSSASSSLPRDDSLNPFASQVAGIDAGSVDLVSDPQAAAIRQSHIRHEASIKSAGLLYYLGALYGAISFLFLIMTPIGEAVDRKAQSGTAVIFFVVMTGSNFALGYGLRKLQAWTRWTVAVLMVLSMLLLLIVGLAFTLVTNPIIGIIFLVSSEVITGYILYLMVSPKGMMVFSHPYKAMIVQTPHIRCRISQLDRALLVVFALVIIAAVFVQGILTFAPSSR
jgi:serine/threonine protein kinase